MRRILLACLLSSLIPSTVHAQDAAPASPADPNAPAVIAPTHAHDLGSVVVRGVQPGPKLWKVSKGDHVLWILGTLSPLPKGITWDSRRVEAVIAGAQEVVMPPEAKLKSNASVFANLAAVPALIGVRNNPDGRKLREVVPGDLYARWALLKAKYIGSGDKVEHWRPIFAALELYDDAIARSGLTQKPIAEKAVASAARHSSVVVVTPSVAVTVDSPRAAVKEFKKASLDDAECFRKTLDRIDTDLATMTARANAWSTGNLDALRKLPYTDQMSLCQAVLSDSGLSQTHGLDGINARAHQVWLDAVSKSLETNKVTFAMLPIARLLRPEPYLSRLRAMGYTVEEPASSTPDAATAHAD